MQYKIPQNVGIEDKIVGPLTLRQLIIIAVGSGISYTLFAIASKLYEINTIEYIVIAIPALLSAAFAMIKINDIPLLKYLLFFLEFSIKPKKRIWDHRGIAHIVAPDIGEKTKEKDDDQDNILNMQSKKAANLAELTRMLDSGGFDHLRRIEHDDIDDAEDENLVTQAYFGHKKGKSRTSNMYWRTLDAHKKMLDMLAKISVNQIKEGTVEAKLIQKEVQKVKEGVEKMRQKQNTSTGLNKKSKRRRKRKIPQPIRVNNQIDTTNKNQPASYIPQKTSNNLKKQVDKKNNMPDNDKNFNLRELKKGEIEINLD